MIEKQIRGDKRAASRSEGILTLERRIPPFPLALEEGRRERVEDFPGGQ